MAISNIPQANKFAASCTDANNQQQWMRDYTNSGITKNFSNLTVTFNSKNNDDNSLNKDCAKQTLEQMSRKLVEKTRQTIGRAAGDALLPGIGGELGASLSGKLANELSDMKFTPGGNGSFSISFDNKEQMNEFMQIFHINMNELIQMDQKSHSGAGMKLK